MQFLLFSLASAATLFNAEKSVACNPALIEMPTTTQQVADIVKKANVDKRKITAYGAGHSTNAILCPDSEQVAILTKKLSGIVSVDRAKKTVTVKAGMYLSTLMEQLKEYNLMVPGVPDYGGISVAGAIATGAHGSSLRHFSATQDYMIGATLVTGLGDIVTMDESNSDFPALRTNLGAIGIMTEVTLQAVDFQKVKIQHIQLDFDTVPETIVSKVKEHDHAALLYFSENKNAILKTFDYVSPSTPGNGNNPAWDLLPGGGVTAAIVPKVISFLSERFTQNEICLLSEARIAGLRSIGTTEAIGDFGKMYMGGICDSPNCWPVKVDNLEFAVPVARVTEAMRDINRIAQTTKTCFPLFGLYTRFGKQKNTLIGPTRAGDVAYLEVHIFINPTGGPHIGYPFVDEVRQMLATKYNAQPHFGKNFESDFTGIESRIETFGEFKRLMKKYDPNGTFENRFVRNTFATTKTVFTPECALKRTCVCQEDVHCPKEWVCVNGGVFANTKLCKKGRGVGCGRDDECGSNNCFLFKCR